MTDTVSIIIETTNVVKALDELIAATLGAAPKVAGCVAFVMAFVPPPENKDTRLGKVYSWLNLVACNFKYAANKDAPK